MAVFALLQLAYKNFRSTTAKRKEFTFACPEKILPRADVDNEIATVLPDTLHFAELHYCCFVVVVLREVEAVNLRWRFHWPISCAGR